LFNKNPNCKSVNYACYQENYLIESKANSLCNLHGMILECGCRYNWMPKLPRNPNVSVSSLLSGFLWYTIALTIFIFLPLTYTRYIQTCLVQCTPPLPLSRAITTKTTESWVFCNEIPVIQTCCIRNVSIY